MEDRQMPSPLHKEMSRYAMRFAKAVFLGELPLSRGGPIASATMTLLRFDQLYLGVTCHHVLAHYRQLKQAGANLIFQIGPVQFDPLLQLIDEDPKRDLVTFDLTIFRDDIQRSEDSNFVEPHSWPPGAVSDVDVICLAGYPGIWRDQLSPHELRFHSFSLGASQVQASGEEHFVYKFTLRTTL
jgi:hypothetical protein